MSMKPAAQAYHDFLLDSAIQEAVSGVGPGPEWETKALRLQLEALTEEGLTRDADGTVRDADGNVLQGLPSKE